MAHWLFASILAAQAIGAQSSSSSSCASFAPATEIYNRQFYSSATGRPVPIKGISYYPRPNAGTLSVGDNSDFFTETYRHIWERDILEFQTLGVNAIRIYGVDGSLNHDAFMCALQSANIYALIGLAADCLNCAISAVPAPNCYAASLKTRGQMIINEFAKYPNTLGFVAGNEIEFGAASTQSNAPCQKQFIKEMKEYIASCPGMRKVPVGLAIADLNRETNTRYYLCRGDLTDALESADFLGINIYLHCDGTATSLATMYGIKQLYADYLAFNVNAPVLWTEFGCMSSTFPTINGYQGQRNWLQVDALFNPDFRKVFAGGFAFEYSIEYSKTGNVSGYPWKTYGKWNL
jgi:hypothetical protein